MTAPPSPGPEQKRLLRRHFRAIRRQVADALAPALLDVAARQLPALLPAGTHLGLYWPLAGEADLRPLAARGLSLALPAVRAAAATPATAARLVYRPWSPSDPVAADACGIPAPLTPDLPARALGLLLVPALAFDPVRGLRLGYGGGWYDRLRAAADWRRVPALALLPSACLSTALPADSWDVPFDGWLDERGLHRLRPSG